VAPGRETERLLKKHKITPRHRLGQNFLVSEEVIEEEVRNASISPSDTVLEVGAGVGNLTERLLDVAGRVIVVEKDGALVKVLKERFRGAGNLTILGGDVLKIELPDFDRTVSNIPYQISSPLTLKLLKKGFEKGIIIYQREFARRMVAGPGSRDYSRISVATYYYAEARILDEVPPECFYPEPEVHSAIVELTPRKSPPFLVNEEQFFKLVRGLFVHRRKTVKRAFLDSRDLIPGAEKVESALEGVAPEKRVFQLSPEEIAGMCNRMEAGC